MSATRVAQPATRNHLRTFYTLILTQALSLIGSRISNLAVGIWVFNQTGNATPLALVSFFTVIPGVLASSISGAMTDRWDRRYILALADAGQAVGTSLLLLSLLTGSFQLWHLYTVTFIGAIFGVFQQPAFQASVTMLIPDEQRDRANAIQQLTGPVAGMVAPAIAGFTFALIGVVGVMTLLTPYVLSRTGSEVTLGVVLSLFNLGAIVGAIIIGIWGGTRPRIHTMMPALIAVGVFLGMFGMARSPLALAVAALLLMLPLPMIEAPFVSMMQAKVPQLRRQI